MHAVQNLDFQLRARVPIRASGELSVCSKLFNYSGKGLPRGCDSVFAFKLVLDTATIWTTKNRGGENVD